MRGGAGRFGGAAVRRGERREREREREAGGMVEAAGGESNRRNSSTILHC